MCVGGGGGGEGYTGMFVNGYSMWLYVIVVIVIDCFYIVLFSTLEQTQCGLVACDSE